MLHSWFVFQIEEAGADTFIEENLNREPFRWRHQLCLTTKWYLRFAISVARKFFIWKKEKSTKEQQKSNSIKHTKFWKLNMKKKIGKNTGNNTYKKIYQFKTEMHICVLLKYLTHTLSRHPSPPYSVFAIARITHLCPKS